jgi:cell division protein FtsB
MREFQEKKKIRRFIYSKGAAFILIVVTGFVGYSTVKIYLKSREAMARAEQTQKELEELRARKAELEKEVNRLSGEAGVEEIMRKNLNVHKPGERVAIIIDKNPENVNINVEEDRGFFQKLWKWLENPF